MSVAAWLWIIGGLVVAGPLYLFLVVYLGVRAKKKRAAALPVVASKINADYVGADQSILAAFPDGRPFYPRADFIRATGVMRGTIDGVEAIFFDLFASTPEPTSESDNNDEQTVAMFYVGEGRRFPTFQLDRIDGRAGAHWLETTGESVTLPDHPKFTDRFRVVSDDANGVRSLFISRLCAFINAHDGWSIQSTGSWLAVCRRRVLVKPRDYPAFVGEAADFLVAFESPG